MEEVKKYISHDPLVDKSAIHGTTAMKDLNKEMIVEE